MTDENESSMPRKRVLLVTTKLHFGGAEKALVNIAIHLAKRNFEPMVVALAEPPSGRDAGLVRRLESAGITPTFLSLNHSYRFLSGWRRLAKLIRKHQPEAILSFLFHANVLSHFANASSTKTPHIIGIRVSDPIRLRAKVERYVAKRKTTKRIVCVSQTVKKYVANHNYPAEKLTVIPNGIDLKTQPSGKAGQVKDSDSENRKVLILGRLAPQKGTPLLPELFQKCWQNLPEIKFELAGDGPLREWLEDQIRREGWEAKVTLHGFVEEPQRLIRESQLLLLPSLWEGMPNALLEAMALGKPVAAFEADGVRELLEQTDLAQLAKVGDLESLAKIVAESLADQELAATRGARNRIAIEAHFDLEACLEKYERLLHEVIASKF